MLPTTLPMKFGAVMLPVTPSVPVMFAPVPVTTSMLALPAALTLTLPAAAGIFTLLVPLEILDVLTLAKLTPPEPFDCKNCPFVPPVIRTLPTAPKLATPVVVKFNVVTVAEAVTFAPETLLDAVTFAPAIAAVAVTFVVVISPLASTTFDAASPTDNPPTTLNGLSAIILFPYLRVVNC